MALVGIELETLVFDLFFYYRSICIIDSGASRRRTRNARFRARRADHSTTSINQTIIQQDLQYYVSFANFKSLMFCCICGLRYN